MNKKDPKLTALQFNECINNQDLSGLTRLMTDNHAFIDCEGTVHQPKPVMVESWKQFFTNVPDYRNTFTRIQSEGDLVVILGYAYWSEKQAYDPVIWTVGGVMSGYWLTGSLKIERSPTRTMTMERTIAVTGLWINVLAIIGFLLESYIPCRSSPLGLDPARVTNTVEFSLSRCIPSTTI